MRSVTYWLYSNHKYMLTRAKTWIITERSVKLNTFLVHFGFTNRLINKAQEAQHKS